MAAPPPHDGAAADRCEAVEAQEHGAAVFWAALLDLPTHLAARVFAYAGVAPPPCTPRLAAVHRALFGTPDMAALWLQQRPGFNRALVTAARAGKERIVAHLLAAGEDLHAHDNMALSAAAAHGHAPVVARLLAAGADVHAEQGLSLLWAAREGHAEVVRLLLAAGADVHARGDAAVKAASMGLHMDVVAVLEEGGADASARRDEAVRRWRGAGAV